MSRRSHKHRYKPIGSRHSPIKAPGSVVLGCQCGAVQIKPNPHYVPAKSGSPRDVLAWIEARL